MTKVLLQRYEDLQHDELTLYRLTGLKSKGFELLYQAFKKEWDEHFSQFTFSGKLRTRHRSIRKNSIFADTRDALLCILSYSNGYFSQQELALFYEIDQPKASRYLSFLQKIVAQVIEKQPRAVSKRNQQRILNIYKNDKSRINFGHFK